MATDGNKIECPECGAAYDKPLLANIKQVSYIRHVVLEFRIPKVALGIAVALLIRSMLEMNPIE